MKGNRPKIFDTNILRHEWKIGKHRQQNEGTVTVLSKRNMLSRTAGQFDAKRHRPVYPARPTPSDNARRDREKLVRMG
jgi:hypothetical protein